MIETGIILGIAWRSVGGGSDGAILPTGRKGGKHVSLLFLRLFHLCSLHLTLQSTLYQSLLDSIDSLPYLTFPYCAVIMEVRGSIPPRLFNAALSRPDSADAWQTSTTKGELQAGYLGSIDDTLSIRGKRDV